MPTSNEKPRDLGPGYVSHIYEPGTDLACCTGTPQPQAPEGFRGLLYACTGCTVVGPRLDEERKQARLGNASTRELLMELHARGQIHGGYDGRKVAEVAERLLGVGPAGRGTALSSAVLEYRTANTSAPPLIPAGKDWRDLQIVAQEGYFTVLGNCVEGCMHTNPVDALKCRRAEQ